jgi:hypothetical protein
MTHHPLGETRERREELTKQALAEAVRTRMAVRRLRQTNLARWSGVSRSFVQAVLRAEAAVPLFMFLELSHGLGLDDACELLRDVLDRRVELRRRLRRGVQ